MSGNLIPEFWNFTNDFFNILHDRVFLCNQESFKNSTFYFSQSCNKNELFSLSNRAALELKELKECTDVLGMTVLAATLNFYSNTPEVLFSDFFLYIDPLCILTQKQIFIIIFSRHAFFTLLASLQRKVRDRPICSGGPLLKSLVCGEVAVSRGDRKFMQKRCIFDFETHGTLIIWTDQHFLNVRRDRTMYGMSICNRVDIKHPCIIFVIISVFWQKHAKYLTDSKLGK